MVASSLSFGVEFVSRVDEEDPKSKSNLEEDALDWNG